MFEYYWVHPINIHTIYCCYCWLSGFHLENCPSWGATGGIWICGGGAWWLKMWQSFTNNHLGGQSMFEWVSECVCVCVCVCVCACVRAGFWVLGGGWKRERGDLNYSLSQTPPTPHIHPTIFPLLSLMKVCVFGMWRQESVCGPCQRTPIPSQPSTSTEMDHSLSPAVTMGCGM